MFANSNKLMYGCQTTYNSKISYGYMTCQSHTICNNYVIPDNTIVCYVCISHNKAVVSHHSLSRCCRTTVDGHTFADCCIIAYNRNRSEERRVGKEYW